MTVKFGRYDLLERISVGGMAEVFKGRVSGAAGFEKIVAIKRILPNLSDDKEFISMFVDEAKISANLNHSNIAQVFGFGRIENRYFIAMEYIHGKDLKRIQDHFAALKSSMPIPIAIRVILDVLTALEYAHSKRDGAGQLLGIVHRDVSPQNILISYEGSVKIIDFGISKALSRSTKTSTGNLKGKFAYMSPEQVEGEEIDHRSDLFAIGTVFYELLTGKRLFSTDNELATLERVRLAEIPSPTEINPDIPKGLEAVILKALARDPNNRYQQAGEFHEDLEKFVHLARVSFTTNQLSHWMKSTFDSPNIEGAGSSKSKVPVKPPMPPNTSLLEPEGPTRRTINTPPNGRLVAPPLSKPLATSRPTVWGIGPNPSERTGARTPNPLPLPKQSAQDPKAVPGPPRTTAKLPPLQDSSLKSESAHFAPQPIFGLSTAEGLSIQPDLRARDEFNKREVAQPKSPVQNEHTPDDEDGVRGASPKVKNFSPGAVSAPTIISGQLLAKDLDAGLSPARHPDPLSLEPLPALEPQSVRGPARQAAADLEQSLQDQDEMDDIDDGPTVIDSNLDWQLPDSAAPEPRGQPNSSSALREVPTAAMPQKQVGRELAAANVPVTPAATEAWKDLPTKAVSDEDSRELPSRHMNNDLAWRDLPTRATAEGEENLLPGVLSTFPPHPPVAPVSTFAPENITGDSSDAYENEALTAEHLQSDNLALSDQFVSPLGQPGAFSEQIADQHVAPLDEEDILQSNRRQWVIWFSILGAVILFTAGSGIYVAVSSGPTAPTLPGGSSQGRKDQTKTGTKVVKPKVGVKVIAKVETKPKVVPKEKQTPKVETKPEAVAKPKVAPKSKAVAKSKVEPKSKAVAKPKVAPKSKVEPKSKAVAKPKVAPKSKAVAKPKVAPKSKAVAKPKVAPKIAAKNENKGYLIIASKPWARIYLDGKDTKRNTPVPPANPLVVATGRHKITLKVGAKSFDFSVTINRGQKHRLIKVLPVNR